MKAFPRSRVALMLTVFTPLAALRAALPHALAQPRCSPRSPPPQLAAKSKPARTLGVVAVALIANDDSVLMVQRPEGTSHAGKFEVPGGKQESGESILRAAAREMREELGVIIETRFTHHIGIMMMPGITLHLLACKLWRYEAGANGPQPKEGQRELRWVRMDAMCDVGPQLDSGGVIIAM